MSHRPRWLLHPALAALAMATLPMLAAAQDAASGIAETNAAFEAAVAADDVAAVVALYTEDAMLMGPNAPSATGRAAIGEAFTGMMEAVGTLDLTTVEVESFGDTAYEVGTYVLEGADGSHMDHGKYVVIWKRTPDGWKLHRDIYNSDMAATAAGGH